MKKTNKATGVAEWADASYNIQTGCEHGCLYCYARAQRVRFIKMPDRLAEQEWAKPRLRGIWPALPENKRVMFPTTHDITTANIMTCISAMQMLLGRGNDLVVVSKPNPLCIETLCAVFKQYKSKILFRFTIGTLDEDLAKLWEPNAPKIEERLRALRLAFRAGYQTSVSMEPFLGDLGDVIHTVNTVHPWVTETIWIGKMNKVGARVRQASPEIVAAVKRLRENQTDANINRLCWELATHSKIMWKDSIKDVIGGKEAK